jgi:hypothetical protein
VTLIAQGIITAARDQHESFDQRRHPDAIVLRELSMYHRALCAKMIHADEVVLAAPFPIALPLVDFNAGVALPAYHYLHGGTVVPSSDTDQKLPLTLVPWGNRFQDTRFPSAYILGNLMTLRGVASDWTMYASIILSLTPVAADLAKTTDALIVPDTAETTCEAAVAAFMALRGHRDKSLPAVDYRTFKEGLEQAERAFLDDIFLRRGNAENRVREVRSWA